MNQKRDFLRVSDLSLADAREVLRVARILKAEPKGRRTTLLAGKAVAVVLEKPSTRTRVSFEVGIAQFGAQPVVMGTEGSQLGRGEPIKDTARVLARYCDAIVYRTFSTAKLTEMATAPVPVINALSDDGHPVQVLCDVFTIEEAFLAAGDASGIQGKKVVFVGDCSSNMARSFVEAAVLFDFHLVLAAPEGYTPPHAELEAARGHVSIERDPKVACTGAHVVNTDVWTSMGQEAENKKRLHDFEGWTVNAAMLEGARPEAIVLHCLPAHRGEEIDSATLEGPRSRVWDQAENRLHVQKALLLFLLGHAKEIQETKP
jgi:ornithine carbamoyltransferase